jgi:hypothetical protein
MISTLSLPVRGTATRALRTGREGREDLLRCNMSSFYAQRRTYCKHFLHCTKFFEGDLGAKGMGFSDGDSKAFVNPLTRWGFRRFFPGRNTPEPLEDPRGIQAWGFAALGH